MKTLLIALTLATLAVSPAFANECQDDIKKIDEALAQQELTPEKKAELEDMRNQAVQLCGAGNVQEGLDVTSEAKSMLNIQ